MLKTVSFQRFEFPIKYYRAVAMTAILNMISISCDHNRPISVGSDCDITIRFGLTLQRMRDSVQLDSYAKTYFGLRLIIFIHLI